MKVYITKHALTERIYEVDAEPCDYPGMIVVGKGQYFHKGEWHQSLEEAKAAANAMKQRKLASLCKQITKLEAMTF